MIKGDSYVGRPVYFVGGGGTVGCALCVSWQSRPDETELYGLHGMPAMFPASELFPCLDQAEDALERIRRSEGYGDAA